MYLLFEWMKNITFVKWETGQCAFHRMQKKESASDTENVLLYSRIARPHALFKDHAQLCISGSRFHRERKGFCRDSATVTFVCTFAAINVYNFDILV